MDCWAVCCIVRAAVGEDEGVGSPGVGGAHVQRVGGGGADVPRGVQVVQLSPLVDDLASWVLWGSWLPRLLYTWPLKMTDWAERKSECAGCGGIEPHTRRPEFAAAHVSKARHASVFTATIALESC